MHRIMVKRKAKMKVKEKLKDKCRERLLALALYVQPLTEMCARLGLPWSRLFLAGVIVKKVKIGVALSQLA